MQATVSVARVILTRFMLEWTRLLWWYLNLREKVYMDWQEVIDSPYLQDLPFKIELNEYGSIVMTPASYQHGRFQVELASLLRELAPGGTVVSECSVSTGRGVKVPDVIWHSDDFFAKHGGQTPLPAAPEICAEILSPSNSVEELIEKRQLYFEAGAQEVWVCHDDGRVEFFDASGQLPNSSLVSDFPAKID